MSDGFIQAIGCREGNLKNVSVSLPYGSITAVTGVSGSGKSSFAFETLYAEGRRQLLETLDSGGSYFLSKSCSPQVDLILGLPPTIAIKQNRHIRNSISTMGSISHINAFLFSLFATSGEIKCKKCEQRGIEHYNPAFSKKCSVCKATVPLYPPSFFSNQSPYGACQTCGGSGEDFTVDETQLYPDQSLSIDGGGLKYGAPTKGTTKHQFFDNFLKQFGASLRMPIGNFSNEAKVALLYGAKKNKKIKLEFPGLVPDILRLYKESSSETVREQLSHLLTHTACSDCNGMGISLEAQSVLIKGHNVCNLQNMPIVDLYNFIKELSFNDYRDDLIKLSKNKILEICQILIQLGVGYLTLNRKTASLSGGEMHRITMATYLASQLTGVLYILDEPSTGLHAMELPNLISIIKKLRSVGNGNTLAIVEHNKQLIKEADYIVEFGPGPSHRGGEVVFQGKKEELSQAPNTVTSKLLSGNICLTRNKKYKVNNQDYLGIRDACANNLKHVDVNLPLHCLVAITGVSGSGKSSLMFDTFYMEAKTKASKTRARAKAQFFNRDKINQIIPCEQAPIAQNTRSVVATYIDIFSLIREKFVQTNKAQNKKMTTGLFSFNNKDGACPTCNGYGYISPSTITGEDNQILCPICLGKRYKEEILSITYNNKNISEILDMDISDALDFFADDIQLSDKLKIMKDVGLDYLRLGQQTIELSGGERQRLKLALNLMSGRQNNSLYIFDEPSAGLHSQDLQRIINFFDKLLSEGHSIVMVEHNIELISLADYVIDMGPGAGENGGEIVSQGSPSDIMACHESLTGQALNLLKSSR